MKILNLDISKSFKLIPRVYPDLSGITVDNSIIKIDSTLISADIISIIPIQLLVDVRNEITGIEESHYVSVNLDEGYLVLSLIDFNLIINNKYSLILINDNKVIFKTRLFIMNNEMSVQDFSTTKIINNKLEF